jgi:hypothetical protein
MPPGERRDSASDATGIEIFHSSIAVIFLQSIPPPAFTIAPVTCCRVPEQREVGNSRREHYQYPEFRRAWFLPTFKKFTAPCIRLRLGSIIRASHARITYRATQVPVLNRAIAFGNGHRPQQAVGWVSESANGYQSEYGHPVVFVPIGAFDPAAHAKPGEGFIQFEGFVRQGMKSVGWICVERANRANRPMSFRCLTKSD